MARIVCQVLQRDDRITFLWSQDQAFFEPYSLLGPEVKQFHDAATRAWQHVADTPAGKNSQETLAGAGRELYRLIFGPAQADHAATAGKVRQWLAESHGKIAGLEIVSDVPSQIPWNAVYEGDGSDLAGFWGTRYPLTAGRRINPFRLSPFLDEPDVLLVLDPTLPPEQLSAWASPPREQGEETSRRTAVSGAEVIAALKERCPDLICWVGPCQQGLLLLGAERIALAELRSWIDSSEIGSLEPLLLLQVSAEEVAAETGWSGLLQRAAMTFPGLIAWQQPLAPALASSLGPNLLQRLLGDGTAIGQTLQKLRREQGLPALALTAFCPAQVQLGGEPPADLDEQGTCYELPPTPYQPLRSLDREDRPLLAGRDRDIHRFTGIFDEPGQIVMLQGAFGAGKASFLRAGVVPYLEDDNPGFLVLRDRTFDEGTATEEIDELDQPVIAIRPGRDLVGQLAEALCAFCARPFRYTTPRSEQVSVPLPDILRSAVATGTDVSSTAIQEKAVTPPSTAVTSSAPPQPLELGASDQAIAAGPPTTPPIDVPGETVSPIDLYDALQRDASLLGRLLDALTSRLPSDLVIVIEQFEELITQAHSPAEKQRRPRALQTLVLAGERAPRCKFILSLRSEFVGRVLADLPEQGPGLAKVREFLLPNLTRGQLLEALLLPTSSEPIPFTDRAPYSVYGFGYDEKIAEQVVSAALRDAGSTQQSPVALVHALGASLFARAQTRRTKSAAAADYRAVGSGDKALARVVEATFAKLKITGRTRKRLRRVLQTLVAKQPDGTLVRDSFTMGQLIDAWPQKKFEEAQAAIDAAEEAGLVNVQQMLVGGHEGTYVTLADDSLARVVRSWTEEQSVSGSAWRRGMVDTLWVTIPLICLAAATTLFFTRRHFETRMEEVRAEHTKIAEKWQEKAVGMLGPQYVASIAMAQQAWNDGNLVHMRQLLLTQQYQGKAAGEEGDFRGFEWYYLWRLANSERLLLSGHEAPIHALAVSGDGKLLASAGSDGRLFLWDLATGTKRASFSGHRGIIHGLAFSPDQKQLASVGADKLPRLWNIPAGERHQAVDEPAAKLPEQSDTLLTLAWHKNTLIFTGGDGSVVFWDVSKAQPLRTHKAHAGAANALALNPQGKTFATAGADGKILLFDLDSGEKRQTIDAGKSPIQALAFSADGKSLAAGSTEPNARGADLDAGVIRVFDVDKGTLQKTPPMTHGAGLLALGFSPDGKVLASSGKDHVVRLWDAVSFKEIGPIKGHLGWVCSLAFTPDSQTIVTGSYDADVKVWPARPTEDADIFRPGEGSFAAVAISADDKLVAAGGNIKTPAAKGEAKTEGQIFLWSLESNKLLHTIDSLKGPVVGLAFSKMVKGGNVLAAVSRSEKDSSIRAWEITVSEKNVVTAKEVFAQEIKDKSVDCLALSSGGKQIAFSSGPGVEVWDIEQKKKVLDLEAGKESVRCLGYSLDGELLAAGSSDHTIHLWQTDTGRTIPTPTDTHFAPILSLAFMGGDYILSGSSDRTVKFSFLDGKEFHSRQVLSVQPGPVRSLAVSMEGDTIVLAGWDGAIRVQRLVKDKRLIKQNDRLTLSGHAGLVRSLALSNDSQVLASAGDDGTVRIWRAPRVFIKSRGIERKGERELGE